LSNQKATTVRVSGLALQTNPLDGEAPLGSLKVADNVYLRRPGILEPANKLTSTTLTGFPGGVNQMVLKSSADAFDNYVSNFVRATGANDDAAGLQIQDVGTGTSAYFSAVRSKDSATPDRTLQFQPGRTFTTYSRDRRIYSGEQAPVTLTRDMAGSSWELRIAGLQQPNGVQARTSAIAPLAAVTIAPASSQAYYRAVFYRKYQNYTLVSAPSAATMLINSGAAAFAVKVDVNWPDESTPANVGDICIIYRTKFVSIGTDPGSVFQECTRGTLDSTAVANGLITIRDLCPDNNLGPELYTNEGQEGATQANYPPPDSRGVCTYNDTTFYVMNRDWPAVNDIGINDFGSINGGAVVGVYSATNATTLSAGANVIVFSGNLTSNLSVGMVVSQADIFTGAIGYVSSVTYSAGPNQTSVTINNSYGLAGTITGGPLTAGTTTFYVADSVRFHVTLYSGGTADYLCWYRDTDPWLIPANFGSGSSQLRSLVVSSIDAYNTPAVSMSFTQAQTGRIQSFEIYVSHGYAYTRLDTVDSTTQIGMRASVQSTSTSRLYYSKTSLPEAVPPSNYFDVGYGRILRLVTDNNSLYAFCTDGVYRITGAGNDWTVIQISKTQRIVHADAVCTQNGQVFAWCADGLYLVSENGCTNLSTAAVGPSLNLLGGTQLAYFSDKWGTFLASNDYERELYLSSNTWFNDTGNWVHNGTYVFNLNTGSWSTRSTIAPQSAAYVPQLSVLYFPRNASTSSASLYYDVDGNGWEAPTVVFNDFAAGAPGFLKQWIDANLLIDPHTISYKYASPPSYTKNCKMQFLFDNDAAVAQSTNYRYSTEKSLPREHIWVPRRTALKDVLTVGFVSLAVDDHAVAVSVYFQLQGITLRYRVASETFQK
jgi:hypothetical protein